MPGASPTRDPPTTLAALIWPAAPGRSGAALRAAVLLMFGAVAFVIAAKVRVAGPIPMTLQSLAALVLGCVLGFRLAVSSVLLYVGLGALGLPIFAGTPPAPAGLLYLAGPTGGYLAGFVAAAAAVGIAADHGLVARPILFGIVLFFADALTLALGWGWLASPGVVGNVFDPWRAFTLGVQPFLLGEALKVALVVVAVPAVWDAARRLLGR